MGNHSKIPGLRLCPIEPSQAWRQQGPKIKHRLSGYPTDATVAHRTRVELRPNDPLGHLELGFLYQLLDLTNLAVNEWQVAD